jgi:hypothetical protein
MHGKMPGRILPIIGQHARRLGEVSRASSDAQQLGDDELAGRTLPVGAEKPSDYFWT